MERPVGVMEGRTGKGRGSFHRKTAVFVDGFRNTVKYLVSAHPLLSTNFLEK